jgi:WD domain, G-beta repeat
MTKGQVRLLDFETKRFTIIPAHTTPLQAIALSQDEQLLATASTQGTIIRIWSATGAKICEFRRGVDRAIILSMAFSPSGQYLAATSDKSTMHIFDLPGHADSAKDDEKSSVSKPRRPTTSSKPVNISSGKSATSKRSSFGAATGTSPTTGVSGSPASRTSKRASFPSPAVEAARLSLSSSPARASARPTPLSPPPFDLQSNLASITPSDAISHQGLPSASNGAPAWNDMYRAQPQPGRGGPSSIAGASIAESAASSSSSGPSRAQKYGGLANLPFAPRILSDTYSSLSIPFEIGDETKSLSKGQTIADLLAAGRLQKGRIGWIDDDQLVVIGAGHDTRWEKFRMGLDREWNRAIERVGWKKYMEDEGLD